MRALIYFGAHISVAIVSINWWGGKGACHNLCFTVSFFLVCFCLFWCSRIKKKLQWHKWTKRWNKTNRNICLNMSKFIRHLALRARGNLWTVVASCCCGCCCFLAGTDSKTSISFDKCLPSWTYNCPIGQLAAQHDLSCRGWGCGLIMKWASDHCPAHHLLSYCTFSVKLTDNLCANNEQKYHFT